MSSLTCKRRLLTRFPLDGWSGERTWGASRPDAIRAASGDGGMLPR